MIFKYKYNDCEWFDLQDPTQEEVSVLMKDKALDPKTTQELLIPSIKPKIQLHPEYIYLVLHFPVFKHSHSLGNKQEIDFVVGKNFLITSRYDTLDQLIRFTKIIEVDSILGKSKPKHSVGYVFFGVLREMYSSMQDELAFMDDELQIIEKKVFNGEEKKMVFALSRISKKLFEFKKVIGQHEEVLNSLSFAWNTLFGPGSENSIQFMMEEYNKIQKANQSLIDTMSELRETNNSLLSARQGEESKNLTVIAFIFLPISTFLSFFTIDSLDKPIENFWTIVVGALACGILFYLIFKFKKII